MLQTNLFQRVNSLVNKKEKYDGVISLISVLMRHYHVSYQDALDMPLWVALKLFNQYVNELKVRNKNMRQKK